MKTIKLRDCEHGLLYRYTAINSGWTYIFIKASNKPFIKYKEKSGVFELMHGGFHANDGSNGIITRATIDEQMWYNTSVHDGSMYRPSHLKGIHKKRDSKELFKPQSNET